MQIKNILARLMPEALDSLLVTSSANISYLSGFPSRDSYLLISKKELIYITDFRYTAEAKSRLKGYNVLESNGSAFKLIADTCNRLGLRRIGFEERNLSFAEYKKIKGYLHKVNYLVPTHSLVEELREIKSAQELKKIKQAANIAVLALQFAEGLVLAGKKEIEIAGELERFIRYQGASRASFEIIVASGPNSSYPHHLTCARKLQKDEPVLIDIGADCDGYKSDLTRVFFLGKIKGLYAKIYDIVRRAQAKAIAKIKPGVLAATVDAAARQFIAQEGYGAFFGHSLGHGLGLAVHEGPCIAAKENSQLREGMVFTVEPAIYLPGKFGIRLEDMVVVTKKGCEVLSGFLNK